MIFLAIAKPEIFRILLRIAVDAMAQSNINKTRFLATSTSTVQSDNAESMSKSGGFHSPRLP